MDVPKHVQLDWSTSSREERGKMIAEWLRYEAVYYFQPSIAKYYSQLVYEENMLLLRKWKPEFDRIHTTMQKKGVCHTNAELETIASEFSELTEAEMLLRMQEEIVKVHKGKKGFDRP